MNIKIEYAKDWLSFIGEWAVSHVYPHLTYSEKTKNKDTYYTNSQKICCNLDALGRLDRKEWINNIDIISESIEPNSIDDISSIHVNKITIDGSYLILHVKIILDDNKQFACGYVLSDSLNLCGNLYSDCITTDDCDDDDQSDTSRQGDNASLDLTSIYFELPQQQGSSPKGHNQINVDVAIDDNESDNDDILSVTSDAVPATPDAALDAEEELASIMPNEDSPQSVKIARKPPSLHGSVQWQFDTFRSFTRSPVLPETEKPVLSGVVKNNTFSS